MTTRPPVIGITRCSRIEDYVTSIERAGGRPRILETGESPRKVVSEIDGLLLTGGGDIDPVFYGEDRHETVEDAEPGRDEFEIDLARRAIASDVPLLAICRGAQVLNVAAGGSLVQDIPSSVAAPLSHRVTTPRDAHAHEISISAGSRLQQALGSAGARQSCTVNSRHHQSVARLGEGLVAAATAPDGVIEAIEKPEAHFCLGVQWHPENFCRTGEFGPLFESFVAASVERLRAKVTPRND